MRPAQHMFVVNNNSHMFRTETNLLTGCTIFKERYDTPKCK